ncbi:hypothetical protein D9757_004430 [Collybiopsis confluens]|uniref:Uncharacterized protein n=1 Tax=Collybiopsis confluens TaxID=2823264 RepID=A0A8H5HWN2_9AGAR|nr:hypothetical protein D9757_004430 [Collybiopsis confluens]
MYHSPLEPPHPSSFILPPATLEAASRRISFLYQNAIFQDDDQDEDEFMKEVPEPEDGSTLITWPPTPAEGEISRADSNKTAGDGDFGYGSNKVNVLLVVLEVDGPDTIRTKKGLDAGQEISILKMILGDEDGSVCKLTAWRETADAWGGSGPKDVAAKRGDVVLIQNVTTSVDPSTSPTLTASPNLKSKLEICYRVMPFAHEDLRLRPDLRLGGSDASVRKVASMAHNGERRVAGSLREFATVAYGPTSSGLRLLADPGGSYKALQARPIGESRPIEEKKTRYGQPPEISERVEIATGAESFLPLQCIPQWSDRIRINCLRHSRVWKGIKARRNPLVFLLPCASNLLNSFSLSPIIKSTMVHSRSVVTALLTVGAASVLAAPLPGASTAAPYTTALARGFQDGEGPGGNEGMSAPPSHQGSEGLPPHRGMGDSPSHQDMGGHGGAEGEHRGPHGDHRGPEGEHSGPHGDHRGPEGEHSGPHGGHRGPEGEHGGPHVDHRGPEGEHGGPHGDHRGPEGEYGGHGRMHEGPGSHSGPSGEKGDSHKDRDGHRGPSPPGGPERLTGPGGEGSPPEGGLDSKGSEEGHGKGSHDGLGEEGGRGSHQGVPGGPVGHRKGASSGPHEGGGMESGPPREGGALQHDVSPPHRRRGPPPPPGGSHSKHGGPPPHHAPKDMYVLAKRKNENLSANTSAGVHGTDDGAVEHVMVIQLFRSTRFFHILYRMADFPCPQCGFLSSRKSLSSNHEQLPAAIATLLQNNETPPDPESSSNIQNLLQEAENAATDLESQIQLMQASISQLTTQRESIVANIQAYRTVLHPIRRLPREVILEIFEWCVGVNSIEPDSVVTDDPDLKLPGLRVVSSLSSAKAPWILGHISRSWRKIVLSSPNLWSSVSIFLRTEHPTAAVQRRVELAQVSLLALYLTRSQDYPLSLYVNSLHASHPLLSMLYAQSYRWRNAVLYLPVEALRDLSFSIKGAVPLLRSLLFSITRDPTSSSPAQQNWESVMTSDVTVDAFRFAPSLKCLATSQIPSFPSIFSIPWDQLIRFECNLKGEAYQQSGNMMNVDIIRKASDIRMAMFRCCFSPSLRFFGQEPLLHRHLHTLNLFSVLDSNPNIPHVAQFLNLITLPVLRQLSIRTQRRESNGAEDTVVKFVERSGAKFLKALSINDMPMSVEGTRKLMRIIPNVEHLGLSGVTDEVVKMLYWVGEVIGTDGGGDGDSEQATGTVLPKLKRLAFFGSESISINQRLLLGMIESRRSCYSDPITSPPSSSPSPIPSSSSSIGTNKETMEVATASLVDVEHTAAPQTTSMTSTTITTTTTTSLGPTRAILERMELSRKVSFSPEAIRRLDRLLADGLVLDQR